MYPGDTCQIDGDMKLHISEDDIPKDLQMFSGSFCYNVTKH
jgi:hypothetical protein